MGRFVFFLNVHVQVLILLITLNINLRLKRVKVLAVVVVVVVVEVVVIVVVSSRFRIRCKLFANFIVYVLVDVSGHVGTLVAGSLLSVRQNGNLDRHTIVI